MPKSNFKIYMLICTLNKNLNSSLHIYKNIDELEHFKYVWCKKNVFRRYLQSIFILLKRTYVYFDFRRNGFTNNEIEVILYVNSENTYNSLKFLKSEKTLFFMQISSLKKFRNEKHLVNNVRVPLWITMISVFNFPFFVLKYWKKALKYPELYFENFGKDYSNERILLKFKSLKKVVFANDHNVHNRLFKIACENRNIKTAYLQHASVTSMFPKLDFDQNFLFGKIDQHKYESISTIKGETLLIGSPKFDELYKHKRKPKKRNSFFRIGLATNIIDNKTKIESLVNEILEKTNYHIKIRQHPRESRIFNFDSERVRIQSAKDSSLLNFFSDIDFLLAGESSIHLESLYVHIPSFYVNLTINERKDYYEFLKYNLIKELNSQYISNEYFLKLSIEPISLKTLKLFIHSVNEPFDGHVDKFVIANLC